MPTIETFTGTFVDLKDPSEDTILVEDIAQALSRICRFTGHTQVHYSVAEHAVRVAARVLPDHGPRVALIALHHDDAEAYLGDVSAPLKGLLPEYRRLEGRMDSVIRRALALPASSVEDLAAVKEADKWALGSESYHLMPSAGEAWTTTGEYDPDDDDGGFFGLEAAHARAGFLSWDGFLREELAG